METSDIPLGMDFHPPDWLRGMRDSTIDVFLCEKRWSRCRILKAEYSDLDLALRSEWACSRLRQPDMQRVRTSSDQEKSDDGWAQCAKGHGLLTARKKIYL
eukprot:1347991-Amorphochlora_amoeboformis.AAC.1